MAKRKRDAATNGVHPSLPTTFTATASTILTSTRTRRSLTTATNAISSAPINAAESVAGLARRMSRRKSTLNINYVEKDSADDKDISDNRILSSARDDAFSSDSPLSSVPLSEAEASEGKKPIAKRRKGTGKVKANTEKSPPKVKKSKSARLATQEEENPPTEAELKEALTRPPAVNSDYVPIPWKGRLGYACLNTYLRHANPPIFCSRTCRISTILDHDKNDGPGSGMRYVQSLGYANAVDLSKMIEWNERYGIKFLRISSEMFPFASHAQYGYHLDFVAEPLRKAGQLAMKYGHRLTMHPGQFTQIGSPRNEVVGASVRELNYHCEILDGLKLTGQADKDAVMIIHMGGVFLDKPATIERFKKNYKEILNDNIRRRLVLENDDVSYSVEDILPVCQELGIPLVLDWHHHNIVPGAMREGTLDVMEKYGAAIAKTWSDKGITQKQHMSEPREGAVTNRERIRHSKRIRNFPPCANDMDLMLEAKDKEQAVFELMKTYNLPGAELIGDLVPFERPDQNLPIKPIRKKKSGTKKAKNGEDVEEDVEEGQATVPLIPDEEVSMGGPERQVYYPEGNDEWLSPKKRERKKKAEVDGEEVLPEDKPVSKANGRSKGGKKVKEVVVESTAVKISKLQEANTPKARTMRTKSKVAAIVVSEEASVKDDMLEVDEAINTKTVKSKGRTRSKAPPLEHAATAPLEGKGTGVSNRVTRGRPKFQEQVPLAQSAAARKKTKR